MKKSIIITGGAGFIGSYLSERYHQEGYLVIIIDNLFRGKIENIQNIIEDGALFFNIDLIDSNQKKSIEDIIFKYKPEIILHYAAINGTQYFYDIPESVSEVNSIGTYNILKCIQNIKLLDPIFETVFVFASTSETYGEPIDIPSTESSLTYVRIDENRDSYAAAKLMSEFYVKHFCESMAIKWLTFRIFNVYGPRMIGTKYGQVIPEFITRLKNGEYPLKIYGNGSHTRSFIYVSDHVDLVFKSINLAKPNNTYNLGNPEEISIYDLARLIMNKMNLVPNFDFLEERGGDHRRRKPSIDKLFKSIGEQELINIESGIELMLKLY